MNRYKTLLGWLAILVSVAVVMNLLPFLLCSGMVLTNPATFGTLPNDGAFDELLEQLASQGATVDDRREGQPSENLTPLKTYIIHINNQLVNIHEYTSPIAMQQNAARISPDGRAIRLPTMYRIVARREFLTLDHPTSRYFFQHSRFIISYFGDDPTVVSTLKATLGEPFAWGKGEP